MVHQPADGAEVPGDGRRCLWPEERCFCFAFATWRNAEVGRVTGWRIKRFMKKHIFVGTFFLVFTTKNFGYLNFDPHPFEHESSRSFAKHGESMFVPPSVECTERQGWYWTRTLDSKRCPESAQWSFRRTPKSSASAMVSKWLLLLLGDFFAIFWGWVRISCCLIRPRNFKQYVWDSRGRYLQMRLRQAAPKVACLEVLTFFDILRTGHPTMRMSHYNIQSNLQILLCSWPWPRQSSRSART